MNIPPLLEELLRVDGPSGREMLAIEVWRRAASSFSEIESDNIGSTIARVGRHGPILAFFGHIDEIGLVVTHIDREGCLAFAPVGYWDPRVLIGQRVTVYGRERVLPGIIGSVPIHLARAGDTADPEPRLADLRIDIGTHDREAAGRLVLPGDFVTLATEPILLEGTRLTGKALDNRVGAYVALEALRRCSSSGGPKASLAAVASVQEETGCFGARTSAFALRPDIAVVVDARHETSGGSLENELGRFPFGSGPVIGRGGNLSAEVSDLLIATAEGLGMAYSVAGYGSSIRFPGEMTGTDADAIHHTATGIPTGLVSFPLRYMHSPVEMADLEDVEATIQLLAALGSRW